MLRDRLFWTLLGASCATILAGDYLPAGWARVAVGVALLALAAAILAADAADWRADQRSITARQARDDALEVDQ